MAQKGVAGAAAPAEPWCLVRSLGKFCFRCLGLRRPHPVALLCQQAIGDNPTDEEVFASFTSMPALPDGREGSTAYRSGSFQGLAQEAAAAALKPGLAPAPSRPRLPSRRIMEVIGGSGLLAGRTASLQATGKESMPPTRSAAPASVTAAPSPFAACSPFLGDDAQERETARRSSNVTFVAQPDSALEDSGLLSLDPGKGSFWSWYQHWASWRALARLLLLKES